MNMFAYIVSLQDTITETALQNALHLKYEFIIILFWKEFTIYVIYIQNAGSKTQSFNVSRTKTQYLHDFKSVHSTCVSKLQLLLCQPICSLAFQEVFTQKFCMLSFSSHPGWKPTSKAL